MVAKKRKTFPARVRVRDSIVTQDCEKITTMIRYQKYQSKREGLTKDMWYVRAVSAETVDLERFFDTVSHSKLMEILSRTVKDG